MSAKPGRPPLGQRGVVSLTVHKNQRAKRQAKELREEIRDCAFRPARNFQVPLVGYAVVVWAEDGEGMVTNERRHVESG